MMIDNKSQTKGANMEVTLNKNQIRVVLDSILTHKDALEDVSPKTKAVVADLKSIKAIVLKLHKAYNEVGGE